MTQAPPTSSGGAALMDLLGLDVGPTTVPPPSTSAGGLLDLLGGTPVTAPPTTMPTSTETIVLQNC